MVRKLLLWLHLVAGLLAAIVLILLGVTGAVMVFETPIDHALNAKLYRIQPLSTPLGLNAFVTKIEQARPGARMTMLFLSPDDDIAARVSLRGSDGKPVTVTANPYTGEIIGSLATANNFTNKLHQFHKNLLLDAKGKLITGCGALLLIVLSLTGLVLWWPRRIWKLSDLKPGRRTNFDLHNALGFWSSIFLFLFGVTGAVIHWESETARFLDRLTYAPPTPPVPPVKPAPNTPLLGAEELANAAAQAVPGAQLISLMGLGNPRNPVRVAMHFPEDRTPGGRTIVQLHPTTGAVLAVQNSRDAPAAYRFVKLWNRQLHTGDTFGWPTRILACLISLALPLLALTGPLIWWGKFKRRDRGEEA